MLIDTHCHLDDDKLYPEAEKIVADFEKNGISAVITSSSDFASAERNAELSTRYDGVYATVGIHPQEANGRKKEHYDAFIRMADNPKVVAIGEIGLDYFYENSPREIQKTVLCEQMELAYSLKLPAVFHVRDAYGDFLKIVKENSGFLYYGCVVHCYSGSAEFAKELLKYDFYFGFDGPLTYKNSKNAVETAFSVPEDKILVETDSPYLSPVPLRGTVNRPENVVYTARKLAEIRNLSFEQIEQITTKNAKTLFKRLK